MKKTTLLLILTLSFVTVHAQDCCHTLAMNGDFFNDPAFVKAHLPPLPLAFTPITGHMVKFKTPDGKEANAFEVLQNMDKVIFMFHEWWGLNDYIKQEAEKLSATIGASVFAIDLYDGKSTADPQEAANLSKELDEERVRAIISGAIDYKGKNSRIQTIGWCMGGKWSMQATLMAGPNAKGCVMYYGMPETDRKKLEKLACPVIMVAGLKDQWITPAVVNDFKKNMNDLQKPLTVYNYDADHAFANPSNPQYDKASTEEAMKKTIAFMKNNFRD